MSKFRFPKESGITVEHVFGDSKVEKNIPIKDLDKADTLEEAPVITDDKPHIKTKSGKLVDGCALLNLRKAPSMNADVLMLIRCTDTIDILPDPIDPVPGWALVKVDAIEGYVIKKFIKEV